jgi:hypothetical protein
LPDREVFEAGIFHDLKIQKIKDSRIEELG